ncbi:MAG: hypothetical protein Q8S15_01725 [Erysipelotrichaceae bacterium]|nr:hypothetical protein [Erysipelotrichaceae bacterium]MDP3304783.1 hypothetical protein [Erysipelotrichaceae bacterium]
MRKFLIYTIALLILVFTFNHNNISAYNETDFKPSNKFVSLINALKSNDDVMVTLNGEDATALLSISIKTNSIGESEQ